MTTTATTAATSTGTVPAAELLQRVDEFLVEHVDPVVAHEEACDRYPGDLARRLAGMGVVGVAFAETWGGGGSSYDTYCRIIERIARSWFALAETLHIHVLACQALATHGSPEQKTRWLPDMLAGRIWAGNCMSESDAGSDLAAMTTRAVAVDDAVHGPAYTITGSKAWVGHGGIADVYIVYCRTGSAGVGGISCFLVEAGSDGLSARPPERKMAVRTLPTATVDLDGVVVPAENRIGRENRGMLVAATVFDYGRLGLAACGLGLAQAALDYAVAYAKRRFQFGVPIMTHQGVSFMLADMATQVAAGRALLHAATAARDAGTPFSTLSAQSKLFISDTAMRVTTDAVQVLGGYGYIADHPTERWMREAKLTQLIEGTNQIQRIAIAASL